MVAQPLSMGKEPDTNPHPLLIPTAHTVENPKKLNFEVLEHPLYSLDLTLSDSPVWSTYTSLKRPSVYHGRATGCNGACVACLSAQTSLF
jgi:hypothetical protein